MFYYLRSFSFECQLFAWSMSINTRSLHLWGGRGEALAMNLLLASNQRSFDIQNSGCWFRHSPIDTHFIHSNAPIKIGLTLSPRACQDSIVKTVLRGFECFPYTYQMTTIYRRHLCIYLLTTAYGSVMSFCFILHCFLEFYNSSDSLH